MTKVIGTRGKVVNFQVLGISETVRMLQVVGKKIEAGADFGVVRAGTFIAGEVKESIAGNRVEHKSVDTGLLINSIEFDKTGKAEGVIRPKRDAYPNGQNTQDVATILEFGTSRIHPRSHFRNTKTRTQSKAKDIIKKEIKLK